MCNNELKHLTFNLFLHITFLWWITLLGINICFPKLSHYPGMWLPCTWKQHKYECARRVISNQHFPVQRHLSITTALLWIVSWESISIRWKIGCWIINARLLRKKMFSLRLKKSKYICGKYLNIIAKFLGSKSFLHKHRSRTNFSLLPSSLERPCRDLLKSSDKNGSESSAM